VLDILFLPGYDVGILGYPMIRTAICTEDVVTNEELSVSSDEFIEGLHYRSWIIQTSGSNAVTTTRSNCTPDHHLREIFL
jgi:hypothetical protein